MTDQPPEAVAVLVDAPLARPGDRPKANPAQLYIASLNTRQSRQTGVEAMKRLLKVFGHQDADWWTFPWWKMTAQETTIAREALLQAYRPSTVRLTICAMRQILMQCYRLELMSAEAYQRAILLPKIKAKSAPAGRMLDPDEIRCLDAHINTLGGDYGAMVAAVFALGLGGGLRREELATVRVDTLADDGLSILFVGKGSIERDQPLPTWASVCVRRWLAVRGERSSGTMFLRTQGRFLKDREPSVWSIWSLIVDTGKAAGVADFTPHDLRRTFASQMLDLGDLPLTQQAMAHESSATTARYDRRGRARMVEIVSRLDGYGFGK